METKSSSNSIADSSERNNGHDLQPIYNGLENDYLRLRLRHGLGRSAMLRGSTEPASVSSTASAPLSASTANQIDDIRKEEPAATRWIRDSKWYYPRASASNDICTTLTHVALTAIPNILLDSPTNHTVYQSQKNAAAAAVKEAQLNMETRHTTFHQRPDSISSSDSHSSLPSLSLGDERELTSTQARVRTMQSTSFAKFIFNLLRKTGLSSIVLFLALKYIHRLRLHHPDTKPSNGCEYRLFSIALILANKYLDDKTFTNKTWAGLTGMSVAEINIMEREFLSILEFQLGVHETEFVDWLNDIEAMIQKEVAQSQAIAATATTIAATATAAATTNATTTAMASSMMSSMMTTARETSETNDQGVPSSPPPVYS